MLRARLARLYWEDVWYYLFMLTLLAWDVREVVPHL